jgi:hypothetical protein
MNRVLAILMLAAMAVTVDARIIPLWPYSKLAQEADFIAVVEVVSITNTAARLTGHRDPALYQGKSARLKVGWVIKGEPTTELHLPFFAYSSMAEPNGALFISFNEPDKHQYLVFLKREGETLIPVTGHYDASISVKVLQQDAFSRIDRR